MNLPIISSGEKIGKIEIYYSGRRVNETLGNILKITPFLQGVIFTLLISALYYFFQKKVGRPIEMLNEKIKRQLQAT